MSQELLNLDYAHWKEDDIFIRQLKSLSQYFTLGLKESCWTYWKPIQINIYPSPRHSEIALKAALPIRRFNVISKPKSNMLSQLQALQIKHSEPCLQLSSGVVREKMRSSHLASDLRVGCFSVYLCLFIPINGHFLAGTLTNTFKCVPVVTKVYSTWLGRRMSYRLYHVSVECVYVEMNFNSHVNEDRIELVIGLMQPKIDKDTMCVFPWHFWSISSFRIHTSTWWINWMKNHINVSWFIFGQIVLSSEWGLGQIVKTKY